MLIVIGYFPSKKLVLISRQFSLLDGRHAAGRDDAGGTWFRNAGTISQNPNHEGCTFTGEPIQVGISVQRTNHTN
jgi:hypothetical protein